MNARTTFSICRSLFCDWRQVQWIRDGVEERLTFAAVRGRHNLSNSLTNVSSFSSQPSWRFDEPVLSFVLYLRRSLLLFACFSHTASQILAV
jgi:hypothetical protein